MELIALLLPAVLPALMDGVRMITRRFFGGDTPAEPVNVEERIKLIEAETMKLQVISQLDKPYGEISKWVANLRASFRYLAAGAVILGTLFLILMNGTGWIAVPYSMLGTMLDMSGSIFSFMFGDRMYYHIKNYEKPGTKA